MDQEKQRCLSRRRRLARSAFALAALCFLAALSPVVARLALEVCPEPPEPRPYWNQGSLAAMFFCPLVALRTGRLRDLLLSPFVGLLAGYLDLEATLWLYRSANWSVLAASLAPVWGCCIGGWVAFGQSSRARSALSFAALVLADLAGRLVWRGLCESVVWCSLVRDWSPLLEPFAYSPTAIVAVLLAQRAPLMINSALRIPHLPNRDSPPTPPE